MKTIIIWALLILTVAGCTQPIVREETPPPTRPPAPREEASIQLIHEGRQLLDQGKLDSAIRLFEQAIGLDPNNGQSYFYLAQAWLEKGEYAEAGEFNSLARIYLDNDRQWRERVQKQAEMIKNSQ